MEDLLTELKQAVLDSGMSLNIMLNGSFMKDHGRRITVSCEKENNINVLKFTTRTYFTDNNGIKQSTITKVRYSVLDIIKKELKGSKLFGIEIGSIQQLQYAKLTVVAEYGFVCIESELYQYVRKISETTNRVSFSIGGKQLAQEQVSALSRVFLEQSLINYRDVIYSGNTNRFVRTLLRRNKFYNMRPETFVPVFINVEGIYNPLNNPVLAVKDTKMYKLAVQKNRLAESNGITAYFLTHREICEAFGMTHFVRFKPSIWYELFVGLLQPNNTDFPNKTKSIFIWADKDRQPKSLNLSYAEDDFMTLAQKVAPEAVDDLNGYVKVNALDHYIQAHYNALKYTGPSFIDDNNLTTAKLCSYYNEIELRY